MTRTATLADLIAALEHPDINNGTIHISLWTTTPNAVAQLADQIGATYTTATWDGLCRNHQAQLFTQIGPVEVRITVDHMETIPPPEPVAQDCPTCIRGCGHTTRDPYCGHHACPGLLPQTEPTCWYAHILGGGW